jgi:exonuclease-1
MGITGLLPLLKNITRNVHISQYANQRVAIDAYCWLHRGAYSCSTELCQNIPTVKYFPNPPPQSFDFD